MKFSTALTLASAAAVTNAAATGRVNPTLDVKLEREANSKVKMSVTNKGDNDLRLLNKGTIFDEKHTEKFRVFQGAKKMDFHGIRKRVGVKDDMSKSLTDLKSGETRDFHLDAAELHDLTQGGRFSLLTDGAIPYAEKGSNKLKGVAQYKSNRLDLDVDGEEAKKVKRPFAHPKRATLQADCSSDPSRGSAAQTALSNCQQLASAAAEFARSGDAAKIEEYFGDSGNSTRGTVSARLDAVSQQCGTTDSGVVQQYCTDDTIGACDENVLAYTYPTTNVVVNCDIYYGEPDLATECHQQDKATTTLHEYTHANGVYSPGTDDNAYGYDASTALSTEQAIGNADTYALFANDINLQC